MSNSKDSCFWFYVDPVILPDLVCLVWFFSRARGIGLIWVWHLIESLSGGKVWAQTRLRTTTLLLSFFSQEGMKSSLMPLLILMWQASIKSNNLNAITLLIFFTQIMNSILSALQQECFMVTILIGRNV